MFDCIRRLPSPFRSTPPIDGWPFATMRRLAGAGAVLGAALIVAGCQAQTVSGQGATAQASSPPVTGTTVPTPSLGSATPAQTVISEPEAEPVAIGPRIVALLAPLSGEQRAIGEALVNAAQLAFFDVAGDDLEIRPYDTLGTPLGAEEAIRAAVDDRAELVIGPLFATSTLAAAPYAQAAGVPMISFSNNSAVAGDGVFALGFTPDDQVRRVVRYAAEQGVRRFAALLPDNSYGRTASRALNDTLLEIDGTLPPLVDAETGEPRPLEATVITFYDPAGEDFTGVVRAFADYDARRAALAAEKATLRDRDDALSQQALRRLEVLDTFGDPPYEAVLLADVAGRLQVIAPLLPFYDVDPSTVRMLGTVLWDDPVLAGEPSLAGGWYAAPDPEERRAFLTRYREAFGAAAPAVATIAYDATALAAALDRFNPEDPYNLDTLTMPDGFAGVDGLFRLRLSGVAERGLAIKEFRDGDRVIVDEAPTRFPAPEPAVVVN